MRLVSFLWTGIGEPPAEYVDLQLCRLYQCTPGELDDQDTDRLMEHLMIVGVESEIERKRARKA